MHTIHKCRRLSCTECEDRLDALRKRLHAAISRLTHAKRERVVAAYKDWEQRFYRIPAPVIVPIRGEAARIAAKFPGWTDGMSLESMRIWESVWDHG